MSRMEETDAKVNEERRGLLSLAAGALQQLSALETVFGTLEDAEALEEAAHIYFTMAEQKGAEQRREAHAKLRSEAIDRYVDLVDAEFDKQEEEAAEFDAQQEAQDATLDQRKCEAPFCPGNNDGLALSDSFDANGTPVV